MKSVIPTSHGAYKANGYHSSIGITPVGWVDYESQSTFLYFLLIHYCEAIAYTSLKARTSRATDCSG